MADRPHLGLIGTGPLVRITGTVLREWGYTTISDHEMLLDVVLALNPWVQVRADAPWYREATYRRIRPLVKQHGWEWVRRYTDVLTQIHHLTPALDRLHLSVSLDALLTERLVKADGPMVYVGVSRPTTAAAIQAHAGELWHVRRSSRSVPPSDLTISRPIKQAGHQVKSMVLGNVRTADAIAASAWRRVYQVFGPPA